MRLDEIKARAAAATEGPWVNDSTEIGRPFPGTDTIDVWVAESCHPNGDGIDGEADAEFIAHARTDVPTLVAAVEAVLELHALGIGDLFTAEGIIVVDPVDSFIMACPKEPEFASRFEPVPDLVRTVADYEGLPDGTILEVVDQVPPVGILPKDDVLTKRRGMFFFAGAYGEFTTEYMVKRYVCSVVRLGGSQ